ncbi:MAG: aminotransferase class III-fold pyridoxal phosphate-dependent enzyme [Candidatus Colwellbacteria bacterium]|nr:aminotransferase class III-fold pyridoxal phosphate-dependent enzyme [Candidatus Colwellbacteria bacterium]
MNSGIKLWNKAKKIIPGGNSLLSKRPERFLPDQWPTYFKKAKGCEIWDLDGNKYFDFSYMGIGANILGYADPDVNRAVKKVIDSGSMSTLNAPEEVELAEILLKLHPWAHMVRYGRTGSDAAQIAVRITRAYTKKDKVAFCGYHGWPDWYLAANLAKKSNLDGQLLPGLKPLGVPRGLQGTAIPFHYNKIDELKTVVKKHKIGTIIMEPVREYEPENNFLQKVRQIANKAGAVLIFDEITSGFRMNPSGAHAKYGVIPDIVLYGKGLGNGYPMSVVVGKKKIMDSAQDTFISSTYWTERIGPAAAIATLKKTREKNVPKHLMATGKAITRGWKTSAKKHGLKIKTFGIPPLAHFSFQYGNQNQALLTLFNQEMLERGFITTNAVYTSYAHKKPIVNKYLKNVDEVFSILKDAVDKNDIKRRLKGPIADPTLKRLTSK